MTAVGLLTLLPWCKWVPSTTSCMYNRIQLLSRHCNAACHVLLELPRPLLPLHQDANRCQYTKCPALTRRCNMPTLTRCIPQTPRSKLMHDTLCCAALTLAQVPSYERLRRLVVQALKQAADGLTIAQLQQSCIPVRFVGEGLMVNNSPHCVTHVLAVCTELIHKGSTQPDTAACRALCGVSHRHLVGQQRRSALQISSQSSGLASRG